MSNWKKYGLRILLRQRSIQDEENAKKQKESRQESLLANLALSARKQIQKQVEEDLEPKLDMLLAQKVKPHAIQQEPVAKKEHHFKSEVLRKNKLLLDSNLWEQTLNLRIIR